MKQSQDNTIRVAYDATVLAAARQNPHARTGIFRVAENVARQLLDHPDVELSWTAYGNPGLLGILDELVQEDRSLQAPILAPLRTNRLLSILKKPLDVLTATSLSRLVEPSRRTIEGWQNKAACAVRNFQQVDILHSPYHAFPPRENRSQHPVRFLTVHDLIPIKHPEWFASGAQQRLEHALSQIAADDWVLCISEHTRNDLLEMMPRLNVQNVRVTPLAASAKFRPCVDPGRIDQVRQRYHIGRDHRYFLSVCTLEPRKNLRHLVDVFNRIRPELDDSTRLVLVGTKGWEIEKLFDKLRPSERKAIVVTGYVEDEDLSPLYSDAIAFVYPSLYEGFGLPPLEAMQCGLPVITSDNSSLPEVVGDAGLLVSAVSEDALGDAMLRVYRDKALREHLVSAGRKRASQFSWKRCGDITIAAYRDAMKPN